MTMMCSGVAGMARLAAILLAATAACTAAAAPVETFLNQADWLAAAQHHPGAAVQALPAHTVLMRDAFGAWTPAEQGTSVLVGLNAFPYNNERATATRTLPPPLTTAGQWSGNFGCATPVLTCLGATTATYTLPFPIMGLAGALDYTFASNGPTLDFFDPALLGDPANNPNPFRYRGFYGALFAPTDTITVTWTRPGDDLTRFVLAGAQVLVAPISEAGGFGLFALGLLALAGLGVSRRHA
jgi:hypothetical protein